MNGKKVLIPVISALALVVIAAAVLFGLHGRGIIGNKALNDASVLNSEKSEAILSNLPIDTNADTSTQLTARVTNVVPSTTKATVKPQSEISTVKSKKTDNGEYRKLIAKAYESYGDNSEYSVYDINNDGINELIIKTGTCEADFEYHFYSLDGSLSAIEVGTFGGFHSTMYANEEGPGVIVVCTWGVDGETYHQRVTGINIVDGVLDTKVIIDENKSMDEDDFSNSSMLSTRDVSDASLLDKNAKLIGEISY